MEGKRLAKFRREEELEGRRRQRQRTSRGATIHTFKLEVKLEENVMRIYIIKFMTGRREKEKKCNFANCEDKQTKFCYETTDQTKIG